MRFDSKKLPCTKMLSISKAPKLVTKQSTENESRSCLVGGRSIRVPMMWFGPTLSADVRSSSSATASRFLSVGLYGANSPLNLDPLFYGEGKY